MAAQKSPRGHRPPQARGRLLALRAALVLGFALALAPPPAAPLWSAPPEPEWSPAFEYQVKVGFLYNFTKFVEWPPDAFAGPGAPLIIGVLGSGSFCDALEASLKDKTVNGRPIAVRRFRRPEDLTPTQVLFISPSLGREVGRLLKSLERAPVLTVGDMDRFASLGGIINFTIRDHRVGFEVNIDAASRAGLRISSQLLTVATVVRDATGGTR